MPQLDALRTERKRRLDVPSSLHAERERLAEPIGSLRDRVSATALVSYAAPDDEVASRAADQALADLRAATARSEQLQAAAELAERPEHDAIEAEAEDKRRAQRDKIQAEADHEADRFLHNSGLIDTAQARLDELLCCIDILDTEIAGRAEQRAEFQKQARQTEDRLEALNDLLSDIADKHDALTERLTAFPTSAEEVERARVDAAAAAEAAAEQARLADEQIVEIPVLYRRNGNGWVAALPGQIARMPRRRVSEHVAEMAEAAAWINAERARAAEIKAAVPVTKSSGRRKAA